MGQELPEDEAPEKLVSAAVSQVPLPQLPRPRMLAIGDSVQATAHFFQVHREGPAEEVESAILVQPVLSLPVGHRLCGRAIGRA